MEDAVGIFHDASRAVVLLAGTRLTDLGPFEPEVRLAYLPTTLVSRTEAPPRVSPAHLDWAGTFAREAPVEIDIGSNKGRFLVATAKERPGVNLLGIEIRRSHVDLLRERARKHDLRNVRLLHADAAVAFWELVPAASVAVVHLYHPDPWWKARQKKRRLVTVEFVTDVARALLPEGELRVATDVEEYFGVMCKAIGETGLFDPAPVADGALGTAARPMTSFQEKGVRAGRGIHARIFVRNAAPAPTTPDPRERLSLRRQARRRNG